MTMYEKLMENSRDKVITDIIFNVLHLDKNFPAPTMARRSGRTTYYSILILTKFIIDKSIKGLIFESFEGTEYKPNHLVVYYHTINGAERNCKVLSDVLREVYGDEVRNFFTFKRDRILKV